MNDPDIVNFLCPHCNRSIVLNTSTDGHDHRIFIPSSIPRGVAEDIARQIHLCTHCQGEYYLEIDDKPAELVKMNIIKYS